MNNRLLAPLIATLLLPACVVAPAHGPDYVVAPALPVIVELEVAPYYHGGYYYLYHHRDRSWSYARSRSGPWKVLPPDRYPREIRYKDRERERDRDRRDRD
jgi:hypothetical protein